MSPFQYRQAARAIHQGKVIAYPTEAVFGLGCDPLNYRVVKRLLEIKQRPVSKGLILIASNFSQLEPFVENIEPSLMQPAFESWPGPYTWLFPTRQSLPFWLTGGSDRIAVRVSAHPVVQALCQAARTPLVSTSANRSGQQPARSVLECHMKCPEVDLIVPGEVDHKSKPTVIRDLLSNKLIRP